MSLQIKGRITKVLEVEKGVSKAQKEWKKQGFVIDTSAQYNPLVCFSCFGDDKIAMLNNFKEGQEVEVSFNVSSREYNGKYFHNLEAWRIVGSSDVAPKIDNAPPQDDDLPF